MFKFIMKNNIPSIVINVFKVNSKGIETFISIAPENVKKTQKVSDVFKGYIIEVECLYC